MDDCLFNLKILEEVRETYVGPSRGDVELLDGAWAFGDVDAENRF